MARVTVYPPLTEDDEFVTLEYVGEGINITYFGKVTGRRYRVSPAIPFNAAKEDVDGLLNQKNRAMGPSFRRVRSAAKKAAAEELQEAAPPKSQLPLPPENKPDPEPVNNSQPDPEPVVEPQPMPDEKSSSTAKSAKK